MPNPAEETVDKPGGAKIVGLNLVSTNVSFASERPKETDFVFSYDVEIDEPEKVGDDLYAFAAEFVLEKREEKSENTVASFSAGYLCGIRARNIPEDGVVSMAKTYTATTLWATFSALATIVTSQMNMDFPVLPPAPSKVDLKTSTSEE